MDDIGGQPHRRRHRDGRPILVATMVLRRRLVGGLTCGAVK